ncbi:hypothetical protein PsAD13_00256 [Pseudovibrio sp. Ad13]|uniref:DarT1-associated NADAR antitoxin family protein n=1 Tax=Pseudovibrio sp. Ad13 TaxID=989396 RepID=UPI0007AED5A1|nr:hypothetical protein [Pseudovibrio sp. Ad13]KZK86989.1 hypothetical protein PsAD13_00256 [Pseudovibrio sp. Ad13]
MANRPVFLPVLAKDILVKTVFVEFHWFPGFAKSQKKKSLESLHASATQRLNTKKILDISSKSDERLGELLSAFNLKFTTKKYNVEMCVESAFQGSKIFEKGGPYQDLYNADARTAKKDQRLRSSGRLTGFRFFGINWDLEPLTAFYDWLYINALTKNPSLADEIKYYDAFTDIEFNPQKSINCQAYSAALYRALEQRNLLSDATSSPASFLDILRNYTPSNVRENTYSC